MLKEAWTLAIETLSWMEMQKLSERLALTRTVKQLGMANADSVRFAYRLVCETVRHRNFIDKFINAVIAPRAIGEFDLGVQEFLRLYVYQTRIEKRWSKIDLNEAENIARLARAVLGWRTLKVVEPVLGFLLTKKPSEVFSGVSDEERLGLLTFHPTWFVRYCFKLLGRSEAVTFLQASVHSRPTHIRLNTLKASEKEVLEIVEEEIKLLKAESVQYTYEVLDARKPLPRTKSFKEGFFYIQDKASCFAAQTADPKPGMVILDACAAPGAKTTHLAQLMQNRGTIYSIDYSRRRLDVWEKEVARMGVKIAIPLIADVCNSLPLTIEADIVVLDPPCTSTGAFGRLPSSKWRLTPRSIDKMAEIQWQMINNSARNVKSGGTIIYSTCSITVEENEMIIERFLKWHPEFSLAEITPKIGLPGLRGLERCQRLYPHTHQCNGFFIAKLLRQEQS